MATKLELLEKTVKEQAEQIRTLKQAMLRLEQRVQSVSQIASRAQGKAQRAEDKLKTQGK